MITESTYHTARWCIRCEATTVHLCRMAPTDHEADRIAGVAHGIIIGLRCLVCKTEKARLI